MEAKVIQTIIEVIKGDITKNNHLRSISIPNISTGIYRYPKKEAANVAIHTVVEFINRNDSILIFNSSALMMRTMKYMKRS